MSNINRERSFLAVQAHDQRHYVGYETGRRIAILDLADALSSIDDRLQCKDLQELVRECRALQRVIGNHKIVKQPCQVRGGRDLNTGELLEIVLKSFEKTLRHARESGKKNLTLDVEGKEWLSALTHELRNKVWQQEENNL